jgi:serine protease Do
MSVYTLLLGSLFLWTTAADEPDALQQLELAIEAVARHAAPCVVTIEVARRKDVVINAGTQQPSNALQDLFNQFAQSMRQTHAAYFKRPQAPVTGFIIRSDGLILTSWYNIAGEIDSLRVTLADRRQLIATLLGYDRVRDLALLRIDAQDLPCLTLATTALPAIGSLAIIVSRSEVGGSHGINWGIISATTRLNGKALQIDARTNYGNSGAPVLNLRGELIGSVGQVTHWSQLGQNSGVSFASKASLISEILPRLERGERIEAPKRPFLGIQGEDHANGVRITQVINGSSAQRAGLVAGDVLLRVGGTEVKSMMQLVQQIGGAQVGQTLVVKILRGETVLVLAIELGARTEE